MMASDLHRNDIVFDDDIGSARAHHSPSKRMRLATNKSISINAPCAAKFADVSASGAFGADCSAIKAAKKFAEPTRKGIT